MDVDITEEQRARRLAEDLAARAVLEAIAGDSAGPRMRLPLVP